MDKLGIKASIYDILGYIIPGLLSIIFIYMFMFNKDINWILSLKSANYTIPFYVLVFILSYVAGQIISSLSSFVFESKLSKKILSKVCLNDYPELNSKTNLIFSKDYKNCERQDLNSYCQEKFPVIYDTAFVFLTIYGLSRNLSTSFLILDVYLIKKNGLISIESIIVIISTILLIRNYYRFKKYFELKINSALYL